MLREDEFSVVRGMCRRFFRAFAKSIRSGVWYVIAAAAAFSGTVFAQSWPDKPVRVIVPFAAGGSTDAIARAIMQQVSQNTGRQFIVDNRPGAGGTLGSAEVARAIADGYTLLFTSSTHVIAPQLMPKVPYHPVNDFTPIVHLADAPLVLLVPQTLNIKSAADLIALARKQPNLLYYGSSGNGTTVHLTTEAFKAQAGISITHVPYKGNALATPDLIAGNIQVLFDALPSGMPHVKEGRLRALAITSPRRSALAPEIPTLAEAGLPGFVAVPWFGLYGPRGMDAKLVQAIHDEFAKGLRSAALRNRLATLGAEPGGGSVADFAELAAADSNRWSKVIKASKVTMD